MTHGTTLKARPTTYNGIEMRSRLEAQYAQWLDSLGANWQYEPRCFANPSGQYLPDFLIRGVHFWGATHDVFVEVKPLREWMPAERCREVAEIIWASEPTALFVSECADRELFRTYHEPDRDIWFNSSWSCTTAGQLSIAPVIDRTWRVHP